MPRAVWHAESKTHLRFPLRLDCLAKNLENRPPVIAMEGVEDPALLQVLAENLIEAAGAERRTARAHEEQTPLSVEFENQIRRIPDERSEAKLGIAQLGGLFGEFSSKPLEFVDALRSGFLLVAAQRVPSQRETSPCALT
jgi:hypothetical protein